VCTGLAAEVIRLPPDFFRYCRSPWNKYQADGILYHVIFTRREPIRFAPPLDLRDGGDGAPDEKVQYNKKPDSEENSIHGGGLFLIPQSYGTAPRLSRTHARFRGIRERTPIPSLSSNGLAPYERKSLPLQEDPVLQVDMLPCLSMVDCRHHDDL